MDDDQFATWYERHKPACSEYHDGRTGHMELPGMMHAVRRFEECSTIWNIVVILVMETLRVILL